MLHEMNPTYLQLLVKFPHRATVTKCCLIMSNI